MRALIRRLALLLRTIGWPAVALLLLIPAEALARAGGGEGYHGSSSHGGGGGGYHGGGGGGGGGGDNGLILWLIIQLVSHPAVGIPVLVIVVLLYLYWQKQAQSGGPGAGFGPSPSDGSPSDAMITNAAAWITDVRRNDPAFDENAFYARVRVAFDKIQQSWCAQNLTGVRPFISDAVHERFLLQIAEQRDKGYRDFMEGLQVLDLRMADIESDGIYDEIGVRIQAVSVDYHISLATGQRLSGSAYPEEFVEVWTFVRRQGAKTKDGPGLIEGNCPNCGAAIEMNQSAQCAHCKALLRSGEYDWVLTEITQASEWSGVDAAFEARVADDRIGPDLDVVGEMRILHNGSRADATVLADAGAAEDAHKGLDHGIDADVNVDVDGNGFGFFDGHSLTHQLGRLAGA